MARNRFVALALAVALLVAGAGWLLVRLDAPLRRCLGGDDQACWSVAREEWAHRWKGRGPDAARALQAACDHGSGCACAGLGMLYVQESIFGSGSSSRMAGYLEKADALCPGWEGRCREEDWWARGAGAYAQARAAARPDCLTAKGTRSCAFREVALLAQLAPNRCRRP